MKEKIYERGITLIALVITIVVLLILAGVTLSIVFNGGIINKSQQSVDRYSEQSAREKLEIELINMLAEKVTNPEYNKEEFLTQKLFEAGFSVVNGDIVIVDGWQFEIDRNAPKIINSLGKGTKNEEIKIELSQEVSDDCTSSTVTVQITYSGELKEININGEKINPIPDAVEGVYTITKEIKDNKTVGVLVKDAEDNYNMGNIKVSALTEDMEIKTAEDFKLFRDKVNEGRTFEGRTVMLAQDIDLNQGKYEISEDGNITFLDDAVSWIPIGNYSQNTNYYFAGTFEGNNHTISGLYVNNSADYQGLFGYIKEASISNLKISNGEIYGGAFTGGIVAYCEASNVTKCVNECYIEGNSYIVGGIIGRLDSSNAQECLNAGTVVTNGYNSSGNSHIGGVVGNCINESQISSCVNNGDITGSGSIVGGIVGQINNSTSVIYCYNNGKIVASTNKVNTNGKSYAGGIAGHNGGDTITYCYNAGNVSCSKDTKCPGGIAGNNGDKIINCYTLSSKISEIIGINVGTSSNNVSKSESQMKDESFITSLGGATYWKYVENGFPKLIWEK